MRMRDAKMDVGSNGAHLSSAVSNGVPDHDSRDVGDFRRMLDATGSVAIMLVDEGGQIRRINSGAERMLGWRSHELVGRPVSMLRRLSDLDPGADTTAWAGLDLGSPQSRVWTFSSKNGDAIVVSVHIEPVVDDWQVVGSHRTPSAYVVTATDVTAAVAEATALRRDGALSAAVIDGAPELIIVCRTDGTVIRFNEACEELSGRDSRDVIGMTVWDLSSADPERARDIWRRLLARGSRTSRLETAVVDVMGVSRLIRCRVRRLPDNDAGTGHVVIVGHDITEDREGEKSLRRLAETDALTGLANRPVLAAALQQFVTNSANRSFGHLLFADLDEFKQVNDAHGHPIGDFVLTEIGSRLRSTVRQGDVVARFGGDEFVVFCPGLTPDGAIELGCRLRRAVRAPIETIEGLVRVGVSIGAVPVAPGDDWRELLAMADRQMYDAKRESREPVSR